MPLKQLLIPTGNEKSHRPPERIEYVTAGSESEARRAPKASIRNERIRTKIPHYRHAVRKIGANRDAGVKEASQGGVGERIGTGLW